MSLPIVNTPEFYCTLPSSNEEIKFRPFLIKEEKILYIALESNDPTAISNAIVNILSNCILTEGINVRKLASFDIEYLFLMLRSKSVGELIDISVPHSESIECTHYNKVQINLEDIKVISEEEHTNKISLTDNLGVIMKYPTIEMLSSIEKSEDNKFEQMFNMLAKCIQSVWDENKLYEEFSDEDALNFVHSLSKSQFERLLTFYNTMPKLKHVVKFKCTECGTEDEIVLEGLTSFFT